MSEKSKGFELDDETTPLPFVPDVYIVVGSVDDCCSRCCEVVEDEEDGVGNDMAVADATNGFERSELVKSDNVKQHK